ncbi:MAG: shikimate dehydrogenase [Magnetococcus sp. DMHC-6]
MNEETFLESLFPKDYPTSCLLGVIGDPVAHSLSPKMHNLAIAKLGLNYKYVPFHVPGHFLYRTIQELAARGVVGFNVTIPHKVSIVAMMDDLGEDAQVIGAVNTVLIEPGGKLIGRNTDAYGFQAALEESFPNRSPTRVLLLGAGGAARAVLWGLIKAGSSVITLANRTVEKGEILVDQMPLKHFDALVRVIPLTANRLPLEEVDLVVNTTCLGMKGEIFQAVDLSRLPESAMVMDIIYSPFQTPLLLAAAARGLATANGLGMLIHQGAKSFHLWTGQEMPVAIVRDYLINHIDVSKK